MSLSDWTFYTKTSGSDMITQRINTDDPLTNVGSLEVIDLGLSGVSACTWASQEYSLGLFSGELLTSFRHAAGNGYRRHGCYFYADTTMPLVDNLSGYYLELADSDAVLRLYKIIETPFNEGSSILLTTFMSPMLGDTETSVYLKVRWLGGIFIDRYMGIHITVSYVLNDFDEENMIDLTPYIDIDPFLHTPLSEGFYTRTVHPSETLYGLFDTTTIRRIPARG